jgi:bacterioferritin (cytochrome b1)
MAEPREISPPDRFERAADALETEHRRTSAEVEAFRAFAERVAELSPDGGGTTVGRAAPVQAVAASGHGLDTVRTHYRETVMAVPHYESEYGESYGKNVREELGPDIGALLVGGQRFERHHKHAILSKAREIIELREQLLDALEAERESLTALREQVCSLAEQVDSLETACLETDSYRLLDAYRSRLDVLETRCHELIERRQGEMVTERRALSLPISGPDIQTYLYSDLAVNYPVIATLTDLVDTAATARANIEAELSCQSRS